jgi:hypothetical protein
MLTKTFAAQYSDAGENRVPDLVEATGLVALLADAERLPVVEIPRQVKVEPVTSRHGTVKAAPAVKLQGEGFHVADGEDVIDRGGLTDVPVAQGCRFLSPSCRHPDIGLGQAGQREVDVAPTARHRHVERRSGRRTGRRAGLILEIGGRDSLDVCDAVTSTKPGLLDPFRRGKHRELSARQEAHLARGRARLLTQKIDEPLARLRSELLGLLLGHRGRG